MSEDLRATKYAAIDMRLTMSGILKSHGWRLTARDMQKAARTLPRTTTTRESSTSCAVSSGEGFGMVPHAPDSCGSVPNDGWPGVVSWMGTTHGAIKPTIIAPMRGMAYAR